MNKIRTILILVFLVGIVCTPRVWAGAGAGPGLTITPNKPTASLNVTGNNNQAAATVTITPTNLPQGQSVTVTLEVVYTPAVGSPGTTFAIVGTPLVQPGGTSQRNNVVPSGAVWTVNINFNKMGTTTSVIDSFKVDALYSVGGATVRAQSVTGTVSWLAQQQNPQQGGGQQNQQNQQQNPPQQQTTPPPRQQNQSVFPGPQQQSGGIGSRVQGRGSAVILRRRYNPRRGRVEIVKHGIISQTGFLNLQNTSLQNRRKALRNYRSR